MHDPGTTKFRCLLNENRPKMRFRLDEGSASSSPIFGEELSLWTSEVNESYFIGKFFPEFEVSPEWYVIALYIYKILSYTDSSTLMNKKLPCPEIYLHD